MASSTRYVPFGDEPAPESPKRDVPAALIATLAVLGIVLAPTVLVLGRNGAVMPPAVVGMAASDGYDLSQVDFKALRADLEAFVPACQCAPILVRLSWHDAGTFNATDGTGGSHAEQRFPSGEADDPANAGLGVARGLLAPYKARHPAVSYADLWSLAAAVAIGATGGPSIPWRAGRRDGAEKQAVPHGRLPDGAKGALHLRTIFYRQGFGDRDIVALSGAHTLGRCHADRSGFEGPWTDDPLTFDQSYFQLLLDCDWQPAAAPTTGKPQFACAAEPSLMMLHTDVALVADARFRPHVEAFASDRAAFDDAFTAAFTKLQENGHASLATVPL